MSSGQALVLQRTPESLDSLVHRRVRELVHDAASRAGVRRRTGASGWHVDAHSTGGVRRDWGVGSVQRDRGCRLRSAALSLGLAHLGSRLNHLRRGEQRRRQLDQAALPLAQGLPHDLAGPHASTGQTVARAWPGGIFPVQRADWWHPTHCPSQSDLLVDHNPLVHAASSLRPGDLSTLDLLSGPDVHGGRELSRLLCRRRNHPDDWTSTPGRRCAAGTLLLAHDVGRGGEDRVPTHQLAGEVGEDRARPRLGGPEGRPVMAEAVGTLTLSGRQAQKSSEPVRVDRALLIFWIAAAAYLILAVLSVLALNMMPGHSLSRVAIAQRVIFSRDPHLAAVGFVWNPLQTLPLVPLVPLRLVWPDVVRLGFAAFLVSGGFIAGAGYPIHAILRDFGVRLLPRVLLTAVFALHPMILYYAVNGMSEAMLLFFLLIAVRQLGNWLRSRETLRLVYAGLALGIAYFSRYEALAPAAAAVLLVLLISWLRSRGQALDRMAAALSDTGIIGLPVAAAFIFGALASWIIVGQPFEALTSAYGNAVHMQVAQYQRVAAAVEYSQGWLPATTLAFRRMLTLEPFLLVLLFVAAVQIFRRRAHDAVVPLAVFGAVLLFMLGAYLRGTIFGDLRYFIAVIPVATLLIGALLPGRQPRPPVARPLLVSSRPPGRLVSIGTTALLLRPAVDWLS